MARRISEYVTFVREVKRSFHTTGAILPSGNQLTVATIQPFLSHDRPARILEAEQIPAEYGFEYVSEKTETSLRLNVKKRFGNIEDVMLRCIPETVDHLHRERLVGRQEFQLRIRESFPHGRIKSDCLLSVWFANPSTSMQDGGFEKHLKGMV